MRTALVLVFACAGALSSLPSQALQAAEPAAAPVPEKQVAEKPATEKPAAEKQVPQRPAEAPAVEAAADVVIQAVPAKAVPAQAVAAKAVPAPAAVQVQVAQVRARVRPAGANGEDGEEDVDDAATFHSDRDAMRKISKSEELMADGRWAEAVLYLGSILDGSEDFFFRPKKDQANYRSLKVRALELIAQMPEAGRAAYDLEYGAEARRMLDEAVQNGSSQGLAEVARRFFHTSAGYEATHRLAMYHYDQGRPLAAALFFKRLRSIPAVRATLEPMLTLKVAACLLRVGTSEAKQEAVQLTRELQVAAPIVTLGGKKIDWPAEPVSLAWLEGVLGSEFQIALPGNEEWVLHRGNPARNAPSVGGPPLLNARWRVPTSNDKPNVEKLVRDLQENQVQLNAVALPSMLPLAVKLDLKEASWLQVGAIRTTQWPNLVETLNKATATAPNSAIGRLWSQLSPALREQLAQVQPGQSPEKAVRQRLVDELNSLFTRRDFYDAAAWNSVDLRTEAQNLLRLGVGNLSEDQLFRLNRVLFEALFRREVIRSFCDVVLMRTYNNLLAIDFVTGKRVWEIPVDEADDLLERLLKSDGSGGSRAGGQVGLGLGQRIWHDATFGTLSSDGRYVFSVEDLALWNGGQNPGQNMAVFNRNVPDAMGPKDFNRLAAHDIRTGKLVWEVGGPKGDFELELAGNFFLGPPLPLAGQLYVLAESGSEVRLLVLDGKTGKHQWTQNLAQAPRQVLQDAFRPLAGASPSYADGVLVCPTAAGAAVAVDLTTRSLLWGYRYGGQQQANPRMVMFGGGPQMYPGMMQQRDRWVDSVAVIADGHVLLTPSESNELHCLRLLDGSLAWKQPREDALYIACVRKGEVVLVGSRQIRARSLTDGKPLWATPLPEGALPSGRGFLSENLYFLPLSTAEVVHLDLDKSGLLQRGTKSRGERIPGNLICFKGTVLSQGVDYLESFDELTVLERQVVRDLEANPKDPNALTRRGEILLQKGRIPEAVKDFRDSLSIAPEQRTRELLIESLLEGLRVDFKVNRAAVEEVAKHIDELPPQARPPLKSRFLRLLALGLQNSGDRQAAFTTFLKFIDPEVGPAELERVEGNWSVRRDYWVQGRLEELFKQADPEQRASMELELKSRLDQALAQQGAVGLEQFVQHFGSHRMAITAEQELAKRYMEQGDPLRAELLWTSLRTSNDPEIAKAATAQLAQMLAQMKRPREASLYFKQLAGPLADQVCLNGKTGRELAAQLPPDSPVQPFLKGDSIWPTGMVKQERKGGVQNQGWRYFPVEMRGAQEEFFHQGSIVMDQQMRKFLGRDEFGRQLWETGLPEEGGRFNHIGLNPFANFAQSQGHLLLLCTGQHLFAIDTLSASSTTPARLLWKQSLYQGIPGVSVNQGVHFNFVNRAGQQRMVVQDMYGQPLGPVGPITSKYACMVRRRELLAFHPFTGETLWVRHDATAGSELFGDDELLIMIPPNSTKARVFRALDGQALGEFPVPTENQRLASFGRYVLAWAEANGKQELKLIDIFQKKNVWQHAYASGSKVCMVNSQSEVAIMQPDGMFQILDLPSGKKVVDSKVEAEPQMNEMYVLRSGQHYTAIVSRPWRGNNGNIYINPITGGPDNPIVNGKVHGFARTTGQWLWTTKVENQAISLRQNSELPVLTFACRINRKMGNNWSNECSLLCLDKRTGKIVFDQIYNNENINGVDIDGDPEKKTVQVRLTQSNVQLTFTNDPWPPEKPAEDKAGDKSGDKPGDKAADKPGEQAGEKGANNAAPNAKADPAKQEAEKAEARGRKVAAEKEAAAKQAELEKQQEKQKQLEEEE